MVQKSTRLQSKNNLPAEDRSHNKQRGGKEVDPPCTMTEVAWIFLHQTKQHLIMFPPCRMILNHRIVTEQGRSPWMRQWSILLFWPICRRAKHTRKVQLVTCKLPSRHFFICSKSLQDEASLCHFATYIIQVGPPLSAEIKLRSLVARARPCKEWCARD